MQEYGKKLRQFRLEKGLSQEQLSVITSDKRKITLKTGEEITTTCLRFGDFDILAVNLFAFRGKWEYGFVLNKNLPASNYAKYPEEVRINLIKSIIPISLPLTEPFVSDISILLERLHQEREHS